MAFVNFSSALILATAASLVQGAPTANTPANPSLAAGDRLQFCGVDGVDPKDILWNQTSGGLPFVTDCQKLMRNIDYMAHGNSFHYDDRGQKTIVKYGTCHFGVEPVSAYCSTHSAFLGNQDVTTAIQLFIDRFTWEGRVGSAGPFKCPLWVGGEQSLLTKWGLY